MEKANKIIKEFQNKFKFSNFQQVLKDPKEISFLNILQEHYAMCPIDKAANNIAYLCKKLICPSTPKIIRFIKYYIKHL